jgi:catechol 2,3-dioxygenase-like lactoylglutathione lyase family enzyme
LITGLDHFVVLTSDLDAGVAAYRTLLGCEPSWRSRGAGSTSVVFTLANVSVEIVAPNGDGDADRVGAALDAQGEGLASLCFRVSDVSKMHRRLDRLGLKPEDISERRSTDDASGAMLAWRRTRAATQAAHGVRLFFLEMLSERPRSKVIADGAITALDHVVVNTQNPDRAAALYGARLGLDMALDRARPDWGRLMFFRCGDLIVEVVQRSGQNDLAAPDSVWGLSWRATDIDATHTRLVAAGVDVSEVRPGRKPGTRIMSLRSGTCGVPSVVLQPPPKR